MMILLYSIFSIPLLSALCIYFFQSRTKEIVSLGSLLLLVAIISLYVISDLSGIHFLLFKIREGIEIRIQVDKFGLIFTLLTAILFPINCLYSFDYMDCNNEKNQQRFYIFLFLSVFAVLIVGFADSLITLFLGYELLTVFTIPLIAHKDNKDTIKALYVYLFVLLGSSILFFVPAIIWVWDSYGSLNFINGGFIVAPSIFLILLFMFGCAKSATFPIHLWLPSAMVAPTPVSAFLHAVAVVNTGVFVLFRIFTSVFQYNTLLNVDYYNIVLFIVAFTIVFSGIIAAMQNSLKGRLAYSTISQLGFMNMGIVLLPYSNLEMLPINYMISHAFLKIILFFVAGIIYTVNHRTKIDQLNGIANSMFYVSLLFALSSFGIIGFNIFDGYIVLSKLSMFHFSPMLFSGFLFIGSFLSFVYLFPLIVRMFFFTEPEDSKILEYKERYPYKCLYACFAVFIVFIFMSFLIIR